MAGLSHQPDVVAQERKAFNLSPASKDFISGGLAGALGLAISQPLDTVRVHMQTSARPAGSLATLAHMIRTEGIMSPMKGLAYPLGFAALQTAVLFQAYGESLRWLEAKRPPAVHPHGGQLHHVSREHEEEGDDEPVPSALHGCAAGAAAGFAQVFIWSPIELLKLRVQLQPAPPTSPQYIKPLCMVKHVLRQEGFRGLWRGLSVTMLRDVPSYAVYFGMYHYLSTLMEPNVHPEHASNATQIMAGGTAGVVAWVSIYPLDVIKTRMQAVPAYQEARPGRTWLHYARQVVAEPGGWRNLLKGMQPTLARAFLMDSAMFMGYTWSLRLLGGF